MNVYDGKTIRNICFIGHGGTGKTSLVSAALYASGATTRMGSVDDGNAPTDYDEEEIERRKAEFARNKQIARERRERDINFQATNS